MVGRAVRGRPWFVNQVRAYLRDGTRLADPSRARQLDILLRHYRAMLDYYGAGRGVRIARKHLGWYMDYAGLGGPLRRDVMQSQDPDRVSGLLATLYQQRAAA
jgi:tRNA-dihydrouridine synthase B